MDLSRSITLSDALRSPLGLLLRGDGPPHWLEGNKPQMSAADARKLRRTLIKALESPVRYFDRAAHDDAQAIASWHSADLAERLGACTVTKPCGSGACPICWRALRRLVVYASQHLFSEPGRYRFVTSLCAPERIAHGLLRDADPLAAVERRLMAIATGCRAPIFGGLDISSNEHRQGRFEPHYMPHAHNLVSATAFEQHDTAWNNHFPKHDLVAKAVEASPYDGRRRLIAYCLHPIVERRDAIAAHLAADGTWKRANTSKKPLRRPQRVELALMLDRVGIEARIISYGYDLLTDGNDVWMIKVDRQRADELLTERRQRRVQHRENHGQRLRKGTMTPARARFWL